MNNLDLRKKFINFFKEKGHEEISSSPLLPENDPTVLFVTAGMQPLVPFLTGERHPLGKRLVGIQKCIRTDDMEEVGDNFHHTFFEMLGNWSLGDYFKKESIAWSFEFLTDTKWLGLSRDKLAISVFAGDQDVHFDQESYDNWREIGFSENRIAKMPKKNNWWGPVGNTGPCGPDTEIFFWTGKGELPQDFQVSYDDPSWVEVWNNVFMEYHKNAEGKYSLLKQRNVDTGMGLERMLAVINGLDDNYKTDLFWPVISELEVLSGRKYEQEMNCFRIIADHYRAAAFAISDGAVPSNKGAGYVVRRLLRRAAIQGKKLGIAENIASKIGEKVIEIYSNIYFSGKKEFVLEELEKEENKFGNTLKEGLRLIESIDIPTGKNLFDLYQSFGIPTEISIDEFNTAGKNINKEAIEQLNNLMKSHQELSRTASQGMFKGGLADSSEETTELHTAAHLLLESLRRILGDHVAQKGSNITLERLRFDFSHSERLSLEQIKDIEQMVNEQIEKDLPVRMQEMSLEEAKKLGATGVFEHKYGDKVNVYTIGDPTNSTLFSKEICGGPHVTHTGELGHFKIIKEESSSSGVRRIKAILE